MKELTPNDLDWEAIENARRMTPGERLRLGLDLFDRSCALMRAGIRHQFPDLDDEGVERVLRERLAIARRLENGYEQPQ
jgi:hypothetical protein